MDEIFFNKKGQIADTMTWVVATLIIAFVIGISMAIVSLDIFALSQKKASISDKEKDFLVAKSITSFLRNEDNVNLIKSNDNEKIGAKLKSFSIGLSEYKLSPPTPGDVARSGKGAWGVELTKSETKNGETKIRIYCNEISSRNLAAPLLLKTDMSLDNLKLKFGVDECLK